MALDLSRKTAPPRKNAPATRKTSAASAKETARREGLDGIVQLASAGLLIAGQLPDAAAVQTHGPNIARETATLAENNANVAKIVDSIIAVGPWAALLTATMPLVLQILVNHHRLPAAPLSQFGIQDPDALSAGMQAEIMRQQMEAMQQRADAEAELAEMLSKAVPAESGQE